MQNLQDGESVVNDNMKTSLTVGDIKNIQKYLELQKANCDEAAKAKIDELIKKLDEWELNVN